MSRRSSEFNMDQSKNPNIVSDNREDNREKPFEKEKRLSEFHKYMMSGGNYSIEKENLQDERSANASKQEISSMYSSEQMVIFFDQIDKKRSSNDNKGKEKLDDNKKIEEQELINSNRKRGEPENALMFRILNDNIDEGLIKGEITTLQAKSYKEVLEKGGPDDLIYYRRGEKITFFGMDNDTFTDPKLFIEASKEYIDKTLNSETANNVFPVSDKTIQQLSKLERISPDNKKIIGGLASVTYEFMRRHIPEIGSWPVGTTSYEGGHNFLYNAYKKVKSATQETESDILSKDYKYLDTYKRGDELNSEQRNYLLQLDALNFIEECQKHMKVKEEYITKKMNIETSDEAFPIPEDTINGLSGLVRSFYECNIKSLAGFASIVYDFIKLRVPIIGPWPAGQTTYTTRNAFLKSATEDVKRATQFYNME